MVKIYVFITGEADVFNHHLYTASALTEAGRWLAGAVSGESKETALERCRMMTERKAPEMLSSKFEVLVVDAAAPCVERALFQALSRLP
jgi:hypothetical protein